MDPEMHLQVTLVPELSAAPVAAERLLCGMRSVQVLAQVASTTEGVGTERAHYYLVLEKANLQMLTQVWFRCVRFVTFITRVWLVSRVRRDVFTQIAVSIERGGAIGAQVGR